MQYGWLLLIILSGCMSHIDGYRFKSINIKEVASAPGIGHIYVGMPVKELLYMLGDPNIISLDKKQRKNFVFVVQNKKLSYAKFNIASHIVPSLQLELDYSAAQKITVVVKLDANNRVRDFNYFHVITSV